MNIDSLLALDDEPEMVESWIGELHVWFLIRCFVMQAIIEQQDGLSAPENHSKNLSISSIIRYLFQTFIRSPKFAPRADVVFFSSGVVNMWMGNVYINRLYDYFQNRSVCKSIIIEDSYRYSYRRPRSVKVWYRDIVHLKNFIRAKLFEKFGSMRSDVDAVIGAIRSKVNWDIPEKRWQEARKITLSSVIRYNHFKREYLRILTRIEPKMIIREDACYGGHQALKSVCKNLGIKFGEFQHGLVSRNHTAYNFGKSFHQDQRLRKLLPDFFFSFGKYWVDQIRIPSTKVILGFPYLNALSQGPDDIRLSKVNKKILVVSDGNNPSLYNKLVTFLKEEICLYEKISIILKLHPCEAEEVMERYGNLQEYEDVTIATYEPIYNFLKDVDVVIGCSSTVLYEAIAFSHLPIVYKSEVSIAHLDLKMFQTFCSFEELKVILHEHFAGIRTNEEGPKKEYVWEPEPLKNWDEFIAKWIVQDQ